MKKYWKYLIALAVLATATLVATGCSTWQPAHKKLDNSGYTVSVRFDLNGGTAGGGTYITDAFNLDDYTPDANGNISIRLLELSDLKRDPDKKFAASRTGYFLAGWYTNCDDRVNDNGEPLDDYGNLVSDSGEPQGKIYSGLWNFEQDRVTVNVSDALSAEKPVLTLYAAWIPEIKFEFHYLNGEGSYSVIPTSTPIKSAQLTAPEWNTSTGKLDMKSYPSFELDGVKKTFVAAYMDPEMTVAAPAVINRMDYVDAATGTGKQFTVPIYTEWRDGEWFHIYTAKQLANNSRLDGCYELYADLDFEAEKAIWAPLFASNEFKGTIVSAPGHQYTIKNVTVTQADSKLLNGGLFGVLGTSAVIRDVKFENVTYTVSDGSLSQNANFGLLAGTVRAGATLENVAVSGTLKLGDCKLVQNNNNNIGLLFGYGSVEGMGHEHIQCVLADPESQLQFEVDDVTGEVTVKLPA